MPIVPQRQVDHDLPDDGVTEPLGMTGAMLISERDLGRNRPPRKHRFPFGFHADGATQRYAPARTRHRGAVARRSA